MNKAFFFILFAAFIGLFTGCQRSLLRVRSEPLYPCYLASEHVDTPDPLRAFFIGEQIVIHWKWRGNLAGLKLFLTVRFGDLSVESYLFTPSKTSGFWVVPFVNENYLCKKGLLAFKVELVQDEELIEEWRHHLWVDLIDLQYP